MSGRYLIGFLRPVAGADDLASAQGMAADIAIAAAKDAETAGARGPFVLIFTDDGGRPQFVEALRANLSAVLQ